ncbi:MAG: hypothetical protein RSF40_02185 [Oscillospiraceae bacterium]
MALSISVDKLQLEIIDNSDKAVKGLDRLTASLQKIKSATGSMNSKIRGLSDSNKKLADSNEKVGKLFSDITSKMTKAISKYSVMFLAVRRLATVFADVFNESNKFIEVLNFTAVVFGDLYGKTVAYAEQVQELMGIDISEWLNANATFMQIATGFGVVADKAQLMSANLTQIVYDLSSLRNTSVKDALNAVSSALTGQTKPLLRYGISVHKATLQETAFQHGITKSVSLMTNAEKVMLRYIQIFEASKNAKGDLNRTISTPANSLRILTAQFTQLKRAIGNIVSVFAVKLIPYVQAFVRLATDGANRLAKMFGFELPKIDYLGIDELFSGTEEDVKGTETAVKSLKKQLMGFDEINMINAPDTSTDVLGDSMGGSPVDLELPSYIDDFLKGLDGNLDPYIEKLKTIGKWVEIIGIGFLGWKLTKSFLNGFNNLLTINLPKLGGLLRTVGGKGGIALAIIAGVVALIVMRFVDLYKNCEEFRVGVERIKDVSKIVFGAMKDILGGVIKVAKDVGRAMLNLLPDSIRISIQEKLKSIGLDWKSFGMILLGFSPIEALIYQVKKLGKAFEDKTKPIEIFQKDISKLTKTKCEPFIEEMKNLDNVITELDWSDSIITDEDVSEISNKVGKITDTIISELDGDKNEALKNLNSLKNTIDEETFNNIQSKTSKYYDNMTKSVTDGETRINQIYSTASKEKRKVTDEEVAEVNRIKSQMYDTGLKQLTDNEVEYTTITRRLKDNSIAISLEQASGIIKNAMKTKDETVKSAEDQYSKITLEAERMRDIGIISEEEYQAMIDSAKTAKDETVKSANEQYDDIYNTATEKLGETSKYIDEETGEVQSSWDIFCNGLSTKWSDGWDKVTKWYEDNIAKKITKKYWEDKFKPISDAFQSVVDGIKNIKLPKFKLKWSTKPLKKSDFGYDTLKALGLPTEIPRLSIKPYASGGFPDAGQLFVAREAGAEMVGSIGGKTAVANNDQIVQGIEAGVYNGVLSAMRANHGNGNGNGNGTIVIKVDSYMDGNKVGQGVAEWNNGIVRQGRPSPILI